MFFNNLFNNFSPFSNYSNYPYRNSPRPETFYRSDNRTIITNKLINDDFNYICFDCKRQTNTLKYFDIKNTVFLCYNCALQHNHLPKDVCEVMTGDIRTLEEKYLLLFYYGGNKNLTEFIRRYFPLLEKMNKSTMYTTKAMDYYRKLLIAKAYNQQEPYMPKKLEGYNSIFQNRNSHNPGKMNEINDENSRNNEEMMETEEPNNDLYNSCIFGNGMFGNKGKNKGSKKEPAVINNNEKEKENYDDDVEMKDDTSKKSEDSTYEDAETLSDKENKNEKKECNNNKKYQKGNKNTENTNKENKNIIYRTLTINQLGELSMYPDAREIEEMD